VSLGCPGQTGARFVLPESGASAATKNGLGRKRTSSTMSASVGSPYLKPKDSMVTDRFAFGPAVAAQHDGAQTVNREFRRVDDRRGFLPESRQVHAFGVNPRTNIGSRQGDGGDGFRKNAAATPRRARPGKALRWNVPLPAGRTARAAGIGEELSAARIHHQPRARHLFTPGQTAR